ncbi:MAG: glycosyltransferase family 2 protein [Phycisphaeraceae bacterium]
MSREASPSATPPPALSPPARRDAAANAADAAADVPTPRVSLILPVYNEVGSIASLQSELLEHMNRLGDRFEIIYIDDGSTDGSDRVLAEAAGACPHCRAFRMHRNRGKAAAYSIGFQEARGEILITLDADLQDDPAEIPHLLSELESGRDLVVGWKRGRAKNEPHKTLPSWLFNRIKGRVFGIRLRDSNSGFRVMRAEVARAIDLYAGNYRFLPELAHHQGFRVGEAPVNHRPRLHGKSKYGPSRFVAGVLDLLNVTLLASFAYRPLYFFCSLGSVPLVLGIALEFYVLAMKLSGSRFQDHVAAMIIGVMLILLGIQLLSTGLIGELVLARSRRGRLDPPPHVRVDADPSSPS